MREDETMSLIFVPTPLGNLRDITVRSIDVLREASLVVAEDSRVARRLLSALEIRGKAIWTHHEHNATTTTAKIVERAGIEQVAVITDAGTPGISDPGSTLINAARRALVRIEMLPGPCGFVCAAVLSGFDIRRFTFEGFPPRTSAARRRAFGIADSSGYASVWYESPQRISATLTDLHSVAPEANVFLLREFTKLHEQQVLGPPLHVLARLESPVRGEVMFVIEAQSAATHRTEKDLPDLEARIDALLSQKRPVSMIAKELAEKGLGQRRALYGLVAQRKRARQDADTVGETPRS